MSERIAAAATNGGAESTDLPGEGRGSVLKVLGVATPLGLTSFGGPVARLGYFREEYVRRWKWISEDAYADLVALCQFFAALWGVPAGLVVVIAALGGAVLGAP
jgi:chromate transporter